MRTRFNLPVASLVAAGVLLGWLSGASPADGKDSDWIPTDPWRQFELMFRQYAPTKALFDKTWKLPDVEEVN